MAAVLDHHTWREATATARLADVRTDVEATSTILTQYLQVAGIEPSLPLATALFYGIKTDTMGLVRGASPDDVGDRGTAGGHGTMAGGQIPLGGEEPEQVAWQLGQSALRYLSVKSETTSRPLI